MNAPCAIRGGLTGLAAILAMAPTVESASYQSLVAKDRPVAWWRFEERNKGDGEAAEDASGKGRTGAYRGKIVSCEGVPGTMGQAARFDGASWIEVTDRIGLKLESLTAEFWFRSRQPFDDIFWPGSATFISTATPGPGSADWLINAASQRGIDEGRLFAETGSRGEPKDLYLPSKENDPLNDGHWHHVVLSRAADGEVNLYIDGELHGSGNDGGGSVVNDRGINIGGEKIHPGGSFLRGDMDEVAIYARVLGKDVVASHFNAVKPHLPPRPAKRVIARTPTPPPDAENEPEPEVAPAPLTPLDESIAAAAETHWAFQPIRKPDLPGVRNAAWVRTPVDRFILARLEAAGHPPNRAATPVTLLRRAHFDLLGLPPTPDAVLTAGPANWDELVDDLLASPHYGERYARHWLDVARYADSAGYELDQFFHHSARYRDYVIRSFNADTPFDRFIEEQLAGDLLWPERKSLRDATGFLTVGPYREEGGIKRPRNYEYRRLTDAADSTGDAFLALGVGCARCHDHKFDPVTQRDYFSLQAVFAGCEIRDLPVAETSGKNAEAKRKGSRDRVITNRDRPRQVRLLERGDLATPAGAAPPGTPVHLPGGALFSDPVPGGERDPRVQLATWIASPANPLTARVIANRVWMWHFGQPLVATPNDFGRQGASPTHPELLDYLASYLVAHDWSLKDLHRLIMRSATYRLSSHTSAGQATADPGNLLLARFPRRRLEAEAIWDRILSAAGTLDAALYGPAVFPPINPELMKAKINTIWDTPGDRAKWCRRGIYVVNRRSLTYPFFETFNVTQPILSCARRDSTVVAPQALTLLNDPIVAEMAVAFAARLRRECGRNSDRQIERAWLLAFARPVTEDERAAAARFLQQSAGTTSGKDANPALVEFCRALFNANEFLYVD